MLVSRSFLFDRAKTLKYLDDLEKVSPVGVTVYIPSGLVLPKIERLTAAIPEPISPELVEAAAASTTGGAVFWGPSRKCIVAPPFPLSESRQTAGYDVSVLRSQLRHEFTIALLLVRFGSYAIGVCRGESLLASKVGTGLIHARHRQGGSSSHRFERHRDKQIETFLTRVCGHTREIFEPTMKSIDYIVYGGSSEAILLLKKRCSFLERLEKPALTPLLDLPEPRQPILALAIKRAWSSRITEWKEEE